MHINMLILVLKETTYEHDKRYTERFMLLNLKNNVFR